MIALEQALRTALLHFVWQGVVVAFLLWMALFLMRKRSAGARYIASCLALMTLVALPVLTVCLVYTQPIASRTSGRFFAAVPQTVAAVWTGSVASTPSWLASLGSWAIPAWAFGVILFSLRLAWGSRQVAVLRRSGEPAEGPVVAVAAALASRLGLTRPVRLLITSLTEGPSVVGWIRPVILLPAATLLGLTPEQLEAVLAHEFAHIRRYDYLVNVLQMVVETLLFYHPAVWWTSARIRHERELCCDDLAVSLCGDPVCYARALTKLERLRALAPNMALGSTALGSTDGPLLYRIQRLTGAATRRFGPSRLPGILAVCLAVACVVLSMTWTRVHAQEVKASQAPKVVVAPTPAVADAPGVRVNVDDATVLVRVPVEYPKGAIEDEVEGNVRVEVTVDASGKVKVARVLSGPDELRDSVLSSVQKWNFKSDSTDGPVRVSVRFQLPKVEIDSDDDGDSDVDMDGDRDSDDDVDVSEPENNMSELESSLQEAESAIEEAESELKEKFADLTSQVEEAQHELEKLGKIDEHVNLMDGRTLKRLRILGLSEQSRNDLLKKLPVHEGDKLSKSVMERVEKAIHDFDSQLDCMIVPIEDGDAALVIRRK
jgi:TonB family protein